MRIKAKWKSINPFIPDVNKLYYTKTVTIAEEDFDDEMIRQAAINDALPGYVFDDYEILDEVDIKSGVEGSEITRAQSTEI